MDLLNANDRKLFLEDIISNENRVRKAESLKAFEVYNGRIEQYVIDYLRSQYSEKTVLQMPIISSVNLCSRIANKKSSLYRSGVKRQFTGNLTDDQKDELAKLYAEAEIDSKLFKSNVYYTIQGQNFLKVLVKKSEDGDGGELCVKSLLPHHLDVVPNEDPEKADAYVQSAFDRMQYIKTDGQNQKIADPDDYRAKMQKYYVWTKESNFMFNGKGEIQSEIVPNELGMLPIIDIASDSKDYEFFVRTGQSLVNFTVQYNGALSDLAQVVKMQGWAVAFLKAPSDMAGIKNLSIGPNMILHLPIDPNSPVATEFGYASANPDVAGGIQHTENLVSNFLTSEGADPNLVNGRANAVKYNSGLDRLLAQIEQFESSAKDMSVFSYVEDKLFDLIKRWSQVTFGTDTQFLSFAIPEECEVKVTFAEPSLVQSQKEKLDYLQAKIELGLTTKQLALEELDGIDKESAAAILLEVDNEMMPVLPQPLVTGVNETKANDNNGQSQS